MSNLGISIEQYNVGIRYGDVWTYFAWDHREVLTTSSQFDQLLNFEFMNRWSHNV